MTIQSILVATDLSVPENMVVRRALRLAIAHDATLRLKYMPPTGQKPAADAAARLSQLAGELEQATGMRMAVDAVQPYKVEDLCAEARGLDLLVLPHRRERSTAAFFRGQPVLRVLRTARCPVLVARRTPDADYGRILVAVDFSAESESLLQLAGDLDAHAELELFHAVDTLGEARLRAAEATEHAVRAYRAHCLRHARDRMLTLTDSFVARRDRLLTQIGRGDPGRQVVVQQEHSDADLVVVGKRRTSAWEDFLCGSVAHRVLSWGSSDVLVVPLGLPPATAPHAARRILAVPDGGLRIPAERRTS